MKHFTKIKDIDDIYTLFSEMKKIKTLDSNVAEIPQKRNEILGLLFFNPSLRTRLSTIKAALNLGISPQVIDFRNDSWHLEFEENIKMDTESSEHIIEAAQVLSEYLDIIGIRCFPTLTDKEKDEREWVISAFEKYANIPIINLESATAHPLQAVTDAFTIEEQRPNKNKTLKVVLTWAPHPKALPQSVANSFVEVTQLLDNVDLIITHPQGYELDQRITKNCTIDYNQNSALKDADIVYVKNWSSYTQYGQILNNDPKWMITAKKMALSNQAKLMHCLPLRRNVVISDSALQSNNSIIMDQARNRVYAAQAILSTLLKN